MRSWYQTLFLSSYLGSSIGSVKHLVLRSRKTGEQTRHNLVKRNSQSNVNKSLPFQLLNFVSHTVGVELINPATKVLIPAVMWWTGGASSENFEAPKWSEIITFFWPIKLGENIEIEQKLNPTNWQISSQESLASTDFQVFFTFVSYVSSQDRKVKADASAWNSTNSSTQHD